MDIAEPPFLQLADSPVPGCAELRRVGQAGTVAIRQVIERFHDWRTRRGPSATATAASSSAPTANFGGLNQVNHVQVDVLSLLLSDDQQGNERKEQADN